MKTVVINIKKNLFIAFCACILSSAVLSSSNFGKTHFIVGVNSPKQFPTAAPATDEPCIKHVYFSPDHDLQIRFIEFINHEQEYIKIAVYYFTNSAIAHALLRAHARGIRVEIITDQSCTASKCARIRMLNEGGIPVYVYIANKDKNSLMHNKFSIFGKNIYNKPIVWTGSANFTRTASLYNQENAVIFDDKELVEKFIAHFEVLKARCAPFGNTKPYTSEVSVVQTKNGEKNTTIQSWFTKKCNQIYAKATEWYDACKVY